ncbi:hypothetical protein Plhal703r1_c30g0119291 [Plasmopara halstedii]
MDGKVAEPLEQPQRVALSTVSLDSSYDHEVEDSISSERLNNHPLAFFVVLMGLILLAVCLVIALDHDDSIHNRDALDEEDPAFSIVPSSVTIDRHLISPSQKLIEWIIQAQDASQIDIVGSSSNMSWSGTLFPTKNTNFPLYFDAFMTVYSGIVLPRRQYVALANGRGYQWITTSLENEDIITTSGCLDINQIALLDEFDSVLLTANWALSSDRSMVNVVFQGVKYRISKMNDDLDFLMVKDAGCWLIESEDADVNFNACISNRRNLLSKSIFKDILKATSECPQFAWKNINSMGLTILFVPLPLRGWYASYL